MHANVSPSEGVLLHPFKVCLCCIQQHRQAARRKGCLHSLSPSPSSAAALFRSSHLLCCLAALIWTKLSSRQAAQECGTLAEGCTPTPASDQYFPQKAFTGRMQGALEQIVRADYSQRGRSMLRNPGCEVHGHRISGCLFLESTSGDRRRSVREDIWCRSSGPRSRSEKLSNADVITYSPDFRSSPQEVNGRLWSTVTPTA